jgi:hypothetical protein
MNAVSARLDAPCPASVRRSEPLSELEAFAVFDPVLASLHKQYLDARAMRLKTEGDFGRHDPIYEIAVLAEDSAWCAMQRRYMELRADPYLMKKVQNALERSLREREELLKERAAKEAATLTQAIGLYSRAKPEGSQIYLLLLLACLWQRLQTPWRRTPATHCFNAQAALSFR